MRMTSKLQCVLDIDTFVEAVKIELRLSRVFMIASEGIESWSFHPLPREHVRADVLEEVCNHEDSSLCTHVKTISRLLSLLYFSSLSTLLFSHCAHLGPVSQILQPQVRIARTNSLGG